MYVCFWYHILDFLIFCVLIMDHFNTTYFVKFCESHIFQFHRITELRPKSSHNNQLTEKRIWYPSSTKRQRPCLQWKSTNKWCTISRNHRNNQSTWHYWRNTTRRRNDTENIQYHLWLQKCSKLFYRNIYYTTRICNAHTKNKKEKSKLNKERNRY